MKKQLGFTLIELMVVVMIAALLAALAVPAYTAYIARGKIAQVTGALSEAKVRMEQSFNSVRTYATAPGGTTAPSAAAAMRRMPPMLQRTSRRSRLAG